EERTSGFGPPRRVSCQYQPDSGRSNSGSPSDCGVRSPVSSGAATSATSVRRNTLSRRSNARSTASRYTEDRTKPVINRMMTVEAVAETNRRSASELARIARRSEQVAEAAHRLDHVDAELLADTADEHLDRVRVAIEVLIVEVLDQLGARHHPAGVVHQIGEQPILVRCELDGRSIDGDAAGA